MPKRSRRKSGAELANRKAIKDFGTAAAASSDPVAAGRKFAVEAKARAIRQAHTKTSSAKRALNQK